MEHDFSAQDGYFTTCHLKRNFCGVSNNRSISAIDRERIDRQGANAQEETAAAASASGKQTESQDNSEESNTEEKSPKISSPRWEDENGRTITKALVGYEVFLCADVTDIDDGATATIRIVEKDDDGNDDDLTVLTDKVQDGKIRCDWKVVYMEDNDDTESQKEIEEKGYTLPEYAFTVECDGVESDESPQLDVRGWIKFQLKETESDRIFSNVPVRILKEDGTIIKCKSDENGYVYLKDLLFGKYSIELDAN